MAKEKERESYVSVAGLKDRGWSLSMVEKILGEPDKHARNLHYHSAPPVKLYRLDRVENAEKTDHFIEMQGKAKKRSGSSRAVAEKKRHALLLEVERFPVSIPKYGKGDLIKRACKHYNSLWEDRGKWEKHASPGDSEEFLHRIAVNYLRHVCSEYEEHFVSVFKKVGSSQARQFIARRVYDEIAKTYPFLEDECDRQYDARYAEESPVP